MTATRRTLCDYCARFRASTSWYKFLRLCDDCKSIKDAKDAAR